jgi:alkanesulfonate monooxygenase
LLRQCRGLSPDAHVEGPMAHEYLAYIPNTVEPGHRGDDVVKGWGTLDHSVDLASVAEAHGWSGALLGTGWGRPDTFTVGALLATRTKAFKPLIAVRPGYWQPAQFATAAATLHSLTGGRVLVNVVSGLDNPGAYGDHVTESAPRYARTREFLQIVRLLWSGEPVTYVGEYYQVKDAILAPALATPPPLYFGGASPAAERVSAEEADIQMFWGEPLADIEERIARLRAVSDAVQRRHAPLKFGLRITTVVRTTTDEAWRAAEAKLAEMPTSNSELSSSGWARSVGQQRLLRLRERGEVLDSCLYTAPGQRGAAGAASTWLVGSADDVASALGRYAALGITHFILSDTPYRREIIRLGDELLPRLRQLESHRS